MQRLDWNHIESSLDTEGYALLPQHLAREQIEALVRNDFNGNLPSPLATWRTAFYPRLAALANSWNAKLGTDYRYPATLEAFLERNREAGQVHALSHLSRLREGDDLPLQKDVDDGHVFPFRVVALLNEPGKDFHGGEFVMVERRPRMQSRPMVLPLSAGDVAIVCCTSRPVEGSRGYHRVDPKRAISRVRSGERIGLELAFHDGG